MSKPKVIEVPILNSEYWVYVVWGDGSVRWISKKLNDAYIEDEEIHNYRGKTWHRPSYNPVIHMIVEPGDKHFWGTLAHEATHAIKFIWDSIGEDSFWEVYAHSVGAVVHAVELEISKDKK